MSQLATAVAVLALRWAAPAAAAADAAVAPVRIVLETQTLTLMPGRAQKIAFPAGEQLRRGSVGLLVATDRKVEVEFPRRPSPRHVLFDGSEVAKLSATIRTNRGRSIKTRLSDLRLVEAADGRPPSPPPPSSPRDPGAEGVDAGHQVIFVADLALRGAERVESIRLACDKKVTLLQVAWLDGFP